MNQINYAAVTDQELGQYLIQHREAQIVLQAYIDRLNEYSSPVLLNLTYDIYMEYAVYV